MTEYLMRQAEKGLPQHAPKQSRQASGRMMHVLLVEDDELVRDCLIEMLGEAGARVQVAASAAEILPLLDGGGPVPDEDGAPSVLVTDVHLGPGTMDGYALSAAAYRRWPALHTVLISGDGRAAEHTLAPHERFLPKPFSIDDLVQAVTAVWPAAGRAAPLLEGAPR